MYSHVNHETISPTSGSWKKVLGYHNTSTQGGNTDMTTAAELDVRQIDSLIVGKQRCRCVNPAESCRHPYQHAKFLCAKEYGRSASNKWVARQADLFDQLRLAHGLPPRASRATILNAAITFKQQVDPVFQWKNC